MKITIELDENNYTDAEILEKTNRAIIKQAVTDEMREEFKRKQKEADKAGAEEAGEEIPDAFKEKLNKYR